MAASYSYCVSSNCATVHAAIKIIELHATLSLVTPPDGPADLTLRWPNELQDLYVTVDLRSGAKSLYLLSQTDYSATRASIQADGVGHWRWNEWVHLSHKIRDLPLDAHLVLTVWDAANGPDAPHRTVGRTTLNLFDSTGLLVRGKLTLTLEPLVSITDTVSKRGNVQKSSTLEECDLILNRYENDDLDKLDWLDTLTFKELEKMRKNKLKKHPCILLTVALPKFDFTVVYNEVPCIPKAAAPSTTPFQFDPEIGTENLVEAKHRLLARSHRTGYVDRNLKPNSKTRDELQAILEYAPTTPLSVAERDLLWNYRYYLARDKKALTKFLKSVTWSDLTESRQAIDLLTGWAAPDVDDALELLGPNFENPHVRAYAVRQLERADDEELGLYLLQLVQALKFEESAKQSTSTLPSTDKSDAASANSAGKPPTPAEGTCLADFLIQRAQANLTLCTLLYWYLQCEVSDKGGSAQYVGMYKDVLTRFLNAVSEMPDGVSRREVLFRQHELVNKLTALSREVRASKDTRPRKIEKLRDLLADPRNGLASFPPLPLPLDPSVVVVGIVPSKVSIFKSALMPLRLVFLCENGAEYPVIFKLGDDLRQDQLVIQVISLMDKLLQKENLDLKLTPYKVLATGSDQGFVQFIPSLPLATILAECPSIQYFLRKHNPDDSASSSYGISANAMDTYLRSCAGYSVITYLLGVGDRHLDNLMLRPTGNLFHIDFGYILGRDPKPFPPPMKLCKEMVEAMGGTASVHYARFKNYSFIAFSNLRKSANLLLNLLNLMVDSQINDIALEPDKAVRKVHDKFRLDLAEEEAIQHLNALINESVNSLFPVVIETIHRLAQALRQ